jgi:hypothetical protein
MASSLALWEQGHPQIILEASMRHTPNSPDPEPSRGSRFFLMASTALLALATFPACAGPKLAAFDAVGGIAKLRLGDDLRVAIGGAAPATVYELRLVDGADQLIASRTLTTDTQGAVAPTLLWQRTGVVGCDPGVTPNPNVWQFERFEDAEARHGETLQLLLRKAAGGGTAARLPLPVYADPATPRFYLSDAAACPRFEHEEGAARWVSGVHLEPVAGKERRLWILDPSLGATAPLRDLRSGYAAGQTFVVPTAWQGASLVAVADLPAFFFLWASIEPPPVEPPVPNFDDLPSCLTYPTRYVPSGTQTTPIPVCPPCTSG